MSFLHEPVDEGTSCWLIFLVDYVLCLGYSLLGQGDSSYIVCVSAIEGDHMSECHHSVLSPAALLSSCRLSLQLLLESQSRSCLFFLFPSCLLFSCIIVFPREPRLVMMCLKQDSAVLSFSSSDVSGLACNRAHQFLFLKVRSLRGALPQARFQINPCFPVGLPHCPPFTSMP